MIICINSAVSCSRESLPLFEMSNKIEDIICHFSNYRMCFPIVLVIFRDRCRFEVATHHSRQRAPGLLRPWGLGWDTFQQEDWLPGAEQRCCGAATCWTYHHSCQCSANNVSCRSLAMFFWSAAFAFWTWTDSGKWCKESMEQRWNIINWHLYIYNTHAHTHTYISLHCLRMKMFVVSGTLIRFQLPAASWSQAALCRWTLSCHTRWAVTTDAVSWKWSACPGAPDGNPWGLHGA